MANPDPFHLPTMMRGNFNLLGENLFLIPRTGKKKGISSSISRKKCKGGGGNGKSLLILSPPPSCASLRPSLSVTNFAE